MTDTTTATGTDQIRITNLDELRQAVAKKQAIEKFLGVMPTFGAEDEHAELVRAITEFAVETASIQITEQFPVLGYGWEQSKSSATPMGVPSDWPTGDREGA